MSFQNRIFLVVSVVLILLVSFSGPQLKFYSLKWHLTSTPGGLIYSFFSGGEQASYWLSYMLRQEMPSAGNLKQVVGAFFISLTGVTYLFIEKDSSLLEGAKNR